jgi:putative ABC transport system substrate-binding protein
MGLVESLSRPGQNATGFSDILADLSGKLVDLAKELTRPQTAVGYLWHTAWPDGQNRYRSTEQAAQVAGINLLAKGIADIAELDSALTEIKQSGATTTESIHFRATRTHYRIGDKEWARDHLCLPGRSEGGFIDGVWS